jgi:hypothetical protein
MSGCEAKGERCALGLRSSAYFYSPKCVEEEFSEVHIHDPA